MISFIKGTLYEQFPDSLIVDVNGIGYEVVIHSRACAGLPQIGEPVLLHTHLQVLENEFKLYGFLERSELELFKTLLGVSGIGARGALNMLAAMEPGSFSRAIASQDEKTLTAIPGIGKKTAQRLIFELKDRMGEFYQENESRTNTSISELMEALEVLGYNRSEVFTIVMDMQERKQLGESVEENIKKVLQAKTKQLKS